MRYCILIVLSIAYSLTGNAQRARYNFNPGWLLSIGDIPSAFQLGFDDSHWKPVTLPHAWNEDFAYRVSIHDQPTGIASYRKHFRLPAVAPGSRVFIEFEGVRQAAEVYLNGHRLGLSENGVMAFGLDLTPYLQPADNVIAVRTDNRWDYKEKATGVSVQWNNTNFYSNFGGINKNVWLHISPAVHQTLPLFSSLGTTGQYIWADGFDIPARSATIHIESQVRNDNPKPQAIQLRAQITDINGKPVASATSDSITLAPNTTQILTTQTSAHSLHFWSWGYGYLYNVTTTLLIDGKPTDAVTTRTGFRQTAFHDGMIYLNGRVMQVRLCRPHHQRVARPRHRRPTMGLRLLQRAHGAGQR
jgi:beta-galactosidase